MIDVAVIKRALKVTHDLDDEDLERRVAAAEQECLQYIDQAQLPAPIDSNSEDTVAADIVEGVILMVAAGYEGDPTQRQLYRSAAEVLWTPHRTGWGI